MNKGPDSGSLEARILSVAAEIGALGTGRAALPAILTRLCDPTSSAEDVARVIAQEPGLAARVLRVANSAYYGASGSVASLERAFILLGVDAVRGIAAAACLDRAAIRAVDASPIDLRAMLRHSVAVGAGAEALARLVDRRHYAEAFISGLLHDFGVMIQLQLDREAFARLIAEIGRDPVPIRELEAAAGVVGHERCAQVVFEAWKLPLYLVESIVHHHAPLESAEESRTLALLVTLANELALQLGFGYALEPGEGRVSAQRLAMVGLTPGQLDEITEVLPERINALLQLMR